MNVLLVLSTGVFVLSVLILLTSVLGLSGSRVGKRCTEKAEGTLVKLVDESRGDSGTWFWMEYEVDGKTVENRIPQERVQDLSSASKVGDKATVWYNPSDPMVAVVGNDRFQTKTRESWMKVRSFCLKLAAVSFVVMVIVLRITT